MVTNKQRELFSNNKTPELENAGKYLLKQNVNGNIK